MMAHGANSVRLKARVPYLCVFENCLHTFRPMSQNLKIENWTKLKTQNSCNKTAGIVVAAGENPNSGIHQVLVAVYRITDIREPCLFWGDARLPSGGGLCVSYQSLAGLSLK